MTSKAKKDIMQSIQVILGRLRTAEVYVDKGVCKVQTIRSLRSKVIALSRRVDKVKAHNG